MLSIRANTIDSRCVVIAKMWRLGVLVSIFVASEYPLPVPFILKIYRLQSYLLISDNAAEEVPTNRLATRLSSANSTRPYPISKTLLESVRNRTWDRPLKLGSVSWSINNTKKGIRERRGTFGWNKVHRPLDWWRCVESSRTDEFLIPNHT